MANFRRHVTVGAIPYALFFGIVAVLMAGVRLQVLQDFPPLIPHSLEGIFASFGLALFTSLWPDVDIKSKSQRLIYLLLFILDLLLILEGAYLASALLGLLLILPLLGKHRGWTHSRWSMVLLPSPLLWIPMYLNGSLSVFTGLPYYLAAVIGYATHLFLDAHLLPWQRRRRKRR